jgi:hypothetical protein
VKESAGAELYRDLAKDAHSKSTWGEPKISYALAVRNQDAWNEDWARQYSGSNFREIVDFLLRSRKVARNQKLWRWLGPAAAVAVVILVVIAYYSIRVALLKSRESVSAANLVRIAQDDAGKTTARLAEQLNELNARQGATKEERDRIAREKSDLEAQLANSREDGQKLALQAQKSTDLLASVRSLQTRLELAQAQAQAQATAQAQALTDRRGAENKIAQLEAQITTLKGQISKPITTNPTTVPSALSSDAVASVSPPLTNPSDGLDLPSTPAPKEGSADGNLNLDHIVGIPADFAPTGVLILKNGDPLMIERQGRISRLHTGRFEFVTRIKEGEIAATATGIFNGQEALFTAIVSPGPNGLGHIAAYSTVDGRQIGNPWFTVSFSCCTDLALDDETSKLYLTASKSGSVYVLDLNANHFRQLANVPVWPEFGTGRLSSLAFDKAHNKLFVSDDASAIYGINLAKPRLRLLLGGNGVIGGVDELRDFLYVSQGGRISRIHTTDTHARLTKFLDRGLLKELSPPEVDAKGNVWFVENKKTVLCFSPDGAKIGSIESRR